MDRLSKNLRQIKNILKIYNIKLILAGGAVLGYYRSGDFIPWDKDVDLFLTYEDLYPCVDQIMHDMKVKGFKLKLIDGYGSLKIIGRKQGMKYELTSYVNDGTWYYRKKDGINTAFIPMHFNDNLQIIELRKISYYVPEDIEGYLKYMYKDWKTPCRGKLKDYSSNDYIRMENENT